MIIEENSELMRQENMSPMPLRGHQIRQHPPTREEELPTQVTQQPNSESLNHENSLAIRVFHVMRELSKNHLKRVREDLTIHFNTER